MANLLANLDHVDKFFLMIVGTASIFAGLYMMLKPTTLNGETRLEIFGLKFNSSSGGLVVFLVGAILIIGTALAPENISLDRDADVKSNISPIEIKKSNEKQKMIDNIDKEFGSIKNNDIEIEPNNSNAESHTIMQNIKYEGSLDGRVKDDKDWFYINSNKNNEVYNISVEGGSLFRSGCLFTVYDFEGNKIHSAMLPSKKESPAVQPIKIVDQGAYIEFSCNGQSSYNYILSVYKRDGE